MGAWIVRDGIRMRMGGRLWRWWNRNHKQLEGTSKAPPPAETKRERVVRLAQWGIAHKEQIGYAQIRPIHRWPIGSLPKLPFWSDCSGWVTICYRYAGAADPNGFQFNGSGNTGTLLSHMHHVTAAQVKPGDVVVYGAKTNPYGHHAAVVIGVTSHTAAGIVTSSLGSDRGPMAITVEQECRYQPDGLAGVVYLSTIGK